MLFLFSFLLNNCTPALAGDLLYYKNEKSPGYFQIALEPTRLKIDFSDTGKGPSTSMIYLKGKQKMLIVDHEEKQFTTFDKATIERMSKKMGEANSQIQEAMKNMPPEMRKMMKEQMGKMGQAAAQAMELRVAGKGESVGKWKTIHYQHLLGQEVVSETWTAPLKDVGVEKDNFATIKQMGDFYEKIDEQARSFAKASFSAWKKLDGFPVKTTDNKGKGEQSYLLEKVEKKSFSESDFALPAGFKENTLSF